MHWTLYDLPPELEGDERCPDADAPAEFDPPAELEAAPDFPTLTDCPYCGSRDPESCGCFDERSDHVLQRRRNVRRRDHQWTL